MADAIFGDLPRLKQLNYSVEALCTSLWSHQVFERTRCPVIFAQVGEKAAGWQRLASSIPQLNELFPLT